jgi:hypothetical protein
MMVIDFFQSIPVAVRLTAVIAGSNSQKNIDMRPLCFLCVVQVAVSVTSSSLVQGSPTGYACLILRDLKTSTTRQPRPELVGCAKEKKKILYPFTEVFDNFQKTVTGKHGID